MKILCETTGSFSLLDSHQGVYIEPGRPAIVEMSEFINQRTMLGQLRKVGDVPDTASDAEFAKYWHDSEGNKDLAVSSYLSSFEPAPEPEPVAPVLKTGKNK